MSRSIGVILEVEGLGPTGNPPPEKQRSAIGLAFRLGLEKWMAVAAYSRMGKARHMWPGYLYQREVQRWVDAHKCVTSKEMFHLKFLIPLDGYLWVSRVL